MVGEPGNGDQRLYRVIPDSSWHNYSRDSQGIVKGLQLNPSAEIPGVQPGDECYAAFRREPQDFSPGGST